MNEQVWYVFQSGQQQGPYETAQVTQMIDSKMIAQDAYLFKVGWKDWRPVEDTFEELGMPNLRGPATSARRAGAPRASTAGRVIVHNNGQLVIGGGVNISATGIFVETTDELFNVGEILKLSVRCDGLAKPFNAIAQVIRFNSDSRWPVGYGLRFVNLEDAVRLDIERIVASHGDQEHRRKAN